MHPATWRLSRLRRPAWGRGLACGLALAGPALAQDAGLGAQLYMQLPNGLASCVSCHGPEPQGNRNSLLKAADNPQALVKALATVGVMSYLRAGLDDAGVQHLAAFLGAVNRASAEAAPLTLWPMTADFGQLGLGAVAGPQRVQVHNRGPVALRLDPPALQGTGFSLAHDCPTVLPAGAWCTLQVRAWAGAFGTQLGALVLGSADLPGRWAVGLAARVAAADAGLLQWQADGSGELLDFGHVPTGVQARVQRRLVNAGTAPITLGAAPAVAGSLSLTGSNLLPLNVTGCAAGTVLAPSQQCTVDLRLQGGSAVAVLALLQVRSSGQNPPSLGLSAPASAAAESAPVASAPAAVPVPAPASVPMPEPLPPGTGGGGTGAAACLGLLAAVAWLCRRGAGAGAASSAGAGAGRSGRRCAGPRDEIAAG